MNKEQMRRFAVEVAKTTTAMVVKELRKIHKKQETEYVGTAEAARILGVSPNYLRQIKNQFSHIKSGKNNQGRLLFKRESLLENYNADDK